MRHPNVEVRTASTFFSFQTMIEWQEVCNFAEAIWNQTQKFTRRDGSRLPTSQQRNSIDYSRFVVPSHAGTANFYGIVLQH